MNKFYKKINFLTGSKKIFDLDYPVYNQFDQKICDLFEALGDIYSLPSRN